MIQKIKLIELIKHRLEGEAETKNLGKLHPVVIEYNISQAYNFLLVRTLQGRVSNLDPYTKEYNDVAIAQDATTGVYYSELPAPIIPIPRMAGNGIVRISSTGSNELDFVPVTNSQLKVMYNLMVNDVTDDVISYVFKNGRIEYYGMSADEAAETVNLELVVPFEAYDDTDYVSLPTGSSEALIEMVVNFMIGTPDSDNLNNNNTFKPTSQR